MLAGLLHIDCILTHVQTKWIATLLNDGINPHTNESVIPKKALDAVTAAYSVLSDVVPTRETSWYSYGMGWSQFSYKGHEVCVNVNTLTKACCSGDSRRWSGIPVAFPGSYPMSCFSPGTASAWLP